MHLLKFAPIPKFCVHLVMFIKYSILYLFAQNNCEFKNCKEKMLNITCTPVKVNHTLCLKQKFIKYCVYCVPLFYTKWFSKIIQ